MEKGNKTIFRNKEKLYLLINYRLSGFAISTLSIIFCVDKSSVRYQLHKFAIPNPSRKEVYSIEYIIDPVISKYQGSEWDYIEGMRVNAGSDYKDYIARSKLSPLRK